MGGGTKVVRDGDQSDIGLSPRGRGNPSMMPISSMTARSIPAWAGEPCSEDCPYCLVAVYPRVGGGTVPLVRIVPAQTGLSPRGRGNRCKCPSWHIPSSGLSPRGRGNPTLDPTECWLPWVYPRVGGGTVSVTSPPHQLPGSIPAWAGEPSALEESHDANERSIPAWAGEPDHRPAGPPMQYRVYPRVGGGTSVPTGITSMIVGSIPAWAGEPCSLRTTARDILTGLSPRGRGNRLGFALF